MEWALPEYTSLVRPALGTRLRQFSRVIIVVKKKGRIGVRSFVVTWILYMYVAYNATCIDSKLYCVAALVHGNLVVLQACSEDSLYERLLKGAACIGIMHAN